MSGVYPEWTQRTLKQLAGNHVFFAAFSSPADPIFGYKSTGWNEPRQHDHQSLFKLKFSPPLDGYWHKQRSEKCSANAEKNRAKQTFRRTRKNKTCGCHRWITKQNKKEDEKNWRKRKKMKQTFRKLCSGISFSQMAVFTKSNVTWLPKCDGDRGLKRLEIPLLRKLDDIAIRSCLSSIFNPESGDRNAELFLCI